jgi:hypothetical protein
VASTSTFGSATNGFGSGITGGMTWRPTALESFCEVALVTIILSVSLSQVYPYPPDRGIDRIQWEQKVCQVAGDTVREFF